MPIDSSTMIQRLQSLGAFESASLTRRAYDVTLKALRRGLLDNDADWLALDLGPDLARPLEREVYAGKLSPDELYRWVGRFGGLQRATAKQYVQAVCRALSELLAPATLRRIEHSVPELAPLFSSAPPGGHTERTS